MAAFLDSSMQNLDAIKNFLEKTDQSMTQILENVWSKFNLTTPKSSTDGVTEEVLKSSTEDTSVENKNFIVATSCLASYR